MKMTEYGVQEEFVNVCKSLYEGVEANVLLGGECSRWFEVMAGLSLVLYSIYVTEMLKCKRLLIEVEGT